MTQPTAGPYDVDADRLRIITRTPSGTMALAQVHTWMGREEADANARLFAASRQLLAACKAVIEADHHGMTKEAARSAVALCKSAVRKSREAMSQVMRHEKPAPERGWEILNEMAETLSGESRSIFVSNARDLEGAFTSGIIRETAYRAALRVLAARNVCHTPNPLPCGCGAKGFRALDHGESRERYDGIHVSFCPLHAAAPELLAACKMAPCSCVCTTHESDWSQSRRSNTICLFIKRLRQSGEPLDGPGEQICQRAICPRCAATRQAEGR